MASNGTSSLNQARMSSQAQASPVSRHSPPEASPDSIMHDTASLRHPPSHQAHPSHLYTPVLQETGTADHLGTPYASNRAECPLVSLQPKTSSSKQQASTTVNVSTETASANRDQPTPAHARQFPSAGRGHNIRKQTTPRTTPPIAQLNTPATQSPSVNAPHDGFQIVQSKHKSRGKSTIDQANMQVSGLLLSRVGPKAEIAKQPIPFGDMLQALISIDPNVMIFPYNCAVDSIHKASTLLKRAQDYKALMDITLTNWGSPSEGKGKLAFSFYIGSTIIGEDLDKVTQSRQFQRFLTQSKFKITPHFLHQTESKPVAFFSGKSPKHTWRQNLRDRFQEYLNHYLKDPKAIHNIFGEDEQIPTQIPFYLKVTKIQTKNTAATAIVVFVGKTHHADATTLLRKAPFEDLKMVFIGNCRCNLAVYEKQIKIHQWLCQKSTAVKLRYTTEMFRSAMRVEIKTNYTLQKAIIDVAKASST